MRLAELDALIKSIDVAKEWEDATRFKNAILYDHTDEYDYETSGRDSSGAGSKRGVYRHVAEIDGEPTVMYIGKAQGKTSSIAYRQTCHLRAFRFPDIKSEMSGKKYRSFMEEYHLDELVISIDYIDMTHYHPALISMFEELSIEHFSPVINQ